MILELAYVRMMYMDSSGCAAMGLGGLSACIASSNVFRGSKIIDKVGMNCCGRFQGLRLKIKIENAGD